MNSTGLSGGSGDGQFPPSESQTQGVSDRERLSADQDDAELSEDVSGIHELLKQVAGSKVADSTAPAKRRGNLLNRGDTVGPYRIERPIALGGMGDVYAATGPDGADVAIKICSGRRATQSKIRRQIEQVKQVVEENPDADIVNIYNVGIYDGRFWYAMRRMDGNLCEMLADLRNDTRQCARVLARVARALHVAHTNNIIHRDLKPSNILYSQDVRGLQIAVSDFDVSRTAFGKGAASDSSGGWFVGTFRYFSPEQAAGRAQTPVGDVYAFGVILYEVLTCQYPSRAENPLQLLEEIRNQQPSAPRVSSAPVTKKLAQICMKCLEKAPENRYGSAKEVAEDIDRCLQNLPLSIQTGAFGRMGDYRRRHPFLSTFMMLAVMVMGYGAWWLLALARAREAELIMEAGRANQFQAKLLAVGVEHQLSRFGNELVKAASQPKFRDALRTGTAIGLGNQCDSIRARLNANRHQSSEFSADQRWPVENLFVVDAAGSMKAISPSNPEVLGMNFSHRDYYLGVMRDGGASSAFHISKVYKATGDGKYKFAISVPIELGEDPESRAEGLLVAAFAITPSMGLEYFYDRDTVVAFAGPSDPNSLAWGVPGPSAQSEYMLLLHPAYRDRDKHEPPLTFNAPASWTADTSSDGKPSPGMTQFLLTSMHYNDPAAAINPDVFGGRWVASYAPVGSTHYVVIVQKRYTSITEHFNQAAQPIVWVEGAFLISCGLVVLIGMIVRRDRRPKSVVTSFF